MSPALADAAAWILSLLVLAGVAVGAGEGVRVVLARWLAWFRGEEPLERSLIDLYLGGATLYLLAELPVGLFRPTVLVGAWTVAIAVGAWHWTQRNGDRPDLDRIGRGVRRWLRPDYAVALLAAVVVLCVEVASATGIATGNTFDSSVDATFSALLAAHGNVALTLQPVGSDLVAYPQGSSAWFAAAQFLVGWSAMTTPLRLTPLFLAITPLAGFALGRRWLGTDHAGALFAVGMAVLVPGTRYVAYGSNDFVLAFPLVLLLAARTSEWIGAAAPTRSDALAFGLLTGYSAALNPVGAEWLLTGLAMVGLLRWARHGPDLRRWAAAWVVAAGVGALVVLPSLVALALGAASPGAGPVVGPGGITGAQFLGWTDPFLFGTEHPGLSPDVLVQIELAALVVAGATLLVWEGATRSGDHAEFRRWAATGVASGLLWELLAVAGGSGQGWASALTAVSNGGEVGLLLFTLYGLVALYPVHRLLERAWAREPAAHPPAVRPARATALPAGVSVPVAVAVSLVLLLPGAVATVTLLPAENHSIYRDFSRVTPGEIALLSFAGGWLKAGDRVLVAPGSAAEFLPVYNPTVTVLFPMTGASWRDNATYVQLCAFLVQGTFGAPSRGAGLADLAALNVQYVLVTGNDTALFPAFDNAALLASGDFAVVTSTAAGSLLAYHPPPPVAGAAA